MSLVPEVVGPHDGDMVTYFGMEHASSKDPHDWGRAMCSALNRLLEEAKGDRNYLEHKHLLGQDIVMRIEAEGDGVAVHLSWKPQNQDDAPRDDEDDDREAVGRKTTAGRDATEQEAADREAAELVEGSGRGG
ncbi:hypothetical protein [Sinomonas flava]|uniref:Uncharacterized protein n=1 Tax=Sinomonas flava TaxID=496857 RepID=A0ABN3BXX4_9MICC